MVQSNRVANGQEPPSHGFLGFTTFVAKTTYREVNRMNASIGPAIGLVAIPIILALGILEICLYPFFWGKTFEVLEFGCGLIAIAIILPWLLRRWM